MNDDPKRIIAVHRISAHSVSIRRNKYKISIHVTTKKVFSETTSILIYILNPHNEGLFLNHSLFMQLPVKFSFLFLH